MIITWVSPSNLMKKMNEKRYDRADSTVAIEVITFILKISRKGWGPLVEYIRHKKC